MQHLLLTEVGNASQHLLTPSRSAVKIYSKTCARHVSPAAVRWAGATGAAKVLADATTRPTTGSGIAPRPSKDPPGRAVTGSNKNVTGRSNSIWRPRYRRTLQRHPNAALPNVLTIHVLGADFYPILNKKGSVKRDDEGGLALRVPGRRGGVLWPLEQHNAQTTHAIKVCSQTLNTRKQKKHTRCSICSSDAIWFWAAGVASNGMIFTAITALVGV